MDPTVVYGTILCQSSIELSQPSDSGSSFLESYTWIAVGSIRQ